MNFFIYKQTWQTEKGPEWRLYVYKPENKQPKKKGKKKELPPITKSSP